LILKVHAISNILILKNNIVQTTSLKELTAAYIYLMRIYHSDKYYLNNDRYFTKEEGIDTLKKISNTYEYLQLSNFITLFFLNPL